MQNDPQKHLSLLRAKNTNDLFELLKPYYTYRLYIRFRQPHYDHRNGEMKENVHFYGYEHSCSYHQCLQGHVNEILLDKTKGYQYCIWLAEDKHLGRYRFATLYARTNFPDGRFNILCRHYNKNGELMDVKEANDMKPTDDDNRTIYFETVGGLLQLRDTPIAIPIKETPVEIPTDVNFKEIINNSLNQ